MSNKSDFETYDDFLTTQIDVISTTTMPKLSSNSRLVKDIIYVIPYLLFTLIFP